MAFSYSKLPTVEQAFNLFTPIPLVGHEGSNGQLSLLTSSYDTLGKFPSFSVMNGSNLFIATPHTESRKKITYGVDSLGSTDFGLIMELEPINQNRVKITTTICSRETKEKLLSGASRGIIDAKDENITKFSHLFDLGSGRPQIVSTNVISKPSQLGLVAPYFDDLYGLTTILEYFYSTSNAFKQLRSFRSYEEIDLSEIDAFWESWTEAIKTVLVAAGGIAGGAVGALGAGAVGGPFGAAAGGLAGANIGASLTERVVDWFIA
ncbi:MAG: hypothetical protein F6K14_18175 [Symploca sp. SIO2C1]|nr:hypothetical protein [Symploca sp. SIO2C1]